MLRVRLQKLGSLLGLLAILMVTLAPTVSQVLASHERLGDALATYCTATDADTVSAADPAAQNGKSTNPARWHWQACAYCGLLAHTSVLPGSVVAVAGSLLAEPAALVVVQQVVRLVVVHTAAQPRAPPAFS